MMAQAAYMPGKTVTPETIGLLAKCIAWLFSCRTLSREQLARYMKNIMLEQPGTDFLEKLHERYCIEVEKAAAKRAK